ncbi:calphotin-like [Watersipora subatra]|uniref:calphotin-like n=1 Tax=Watersipora subatra TaxID=2589382 RepID=UPI00355C9D10
MVMLGCSAIFSMLMLSTYGQPIIPLTMPPITPTSTTTLPVTPALTSVVPATNKPPNIPIVTAVPPPTPVMISPLTTTQPTVPLDVNQNGTLAVAPTVTPKVVATVAPTVVPAVVATVTPIVTPTVPPTAAQTVVPTVVPTVTSIVTPTVPPTAAQTVASTAVSMVTPTIVPTVVQSVIPTAMPTIVSTTVPKVVQTTVPTVAPTMVQNVTLAATIAPTLAVTTGFVNITEVSTNHTGISLNQTVAHSMTSMAGPEPVPISEAGAAVRKEVTPTASSTIITSIPEPEPEPTNKVTASANAIATSVPEPEPLTTAPALIANNCSVKIPRGKDCKQFGMLRCPPFTRYSINSCRCEHQNLVDSATCLLTDVLAQVLEPQFIANRCNVKVRAGVGCTQFGTQTCGNGTVYDIKWCVCNHEQDVNKITCSSV